MNSYEIEETGDQYFRYLLGELQLLSEQVNKLENKVNELEYKLEG